MNTIGSLVSNTACAMGETNAYKVQKKDNGSISVLYDNPNIRDEECTFTFNQDGSASCVSHAWGHKTELPKGTIKEDIKSMSGKEMVNLYRSYQKEVRKLDVNA